MPCAVFHSIWFARKWNEPKSLFTVDSPGMLVSKARSVGKSRHHHHSFSFCFDLFCCLTRLLMVHFFLCILRKPIINLIHPRYRWPHFTLACEKFMLLDVIFLNIDFIHRDAGLGRQWGEAENLKFRNASANLAEYFRSVCMCACLCILSA